MLYLKEKKPYWHYHKQEFAPNRADPKFPQLCEQQQNTTLKKLKESYDNVIVIWNQKIKVQYSSTTNTTNPASIHGQ
jgi:hypothetical protein